MTRCTRPSTSRPPTVARGTRPTGCCWNGYWLRCEPTPGAVDLVGSRVLYNEKGLDLTELALSLLRSTGLSVQASADIARSSLLTMMMLVSVQPGVEHGFPQSEWDDLKAKKKAGLAALPADRYPLLLESASALIDCEDDMVYFSAGIDLFLAGVRAQVDAL